MLALGAFTMSANAQIATENSKLFDNVSVGVMVGASTPLDFNSVFPWNANVGLKIQKDFTPVVGVQVEGLAILNDNHFSDLSTVVKATNVGVNGVINWSNFLLGYKGTPRLFEVSSVVGLGWLHGWDTPCNHLTSKTGLDLSFNLGNAKAHSIVVSPAVYWNLNKFGNIAFDKRGAQLAINVGYVYHFKTSNGTHAFKLHDVGALNAEINELRAELAKKPTVIEKVVQVEKATVAAPVVVPTDNQWVVQFAQNSAELTPKAKAVLDSVTDKSVVTIVGSASPEGSAKYNQTLSERRANAVADYLRQRGVTVNSVSGVGADDNASNRLAIVTVTE